MSGKKRFFLSVRTGAVNEEEFAGLEPRFCPCAGQPGGGQHTEIETRPLDSIVATVMQLKIDEIKGDLRQPGFFFLREGPPPA